MAARWVGRAKTDALTQAPTVARHIDARVDAVAAVLEDGWSYPSWVVGTARIRAVELSPEEAKPVLRAFPTEVPTGVGFMKRSGLVRDGRPEEFEALAGRCAVFRLEPI